MCILVWLSGWKRQRGIRMVPPFPCGPVNRQCPWEENPRRKIIWMFVGLKLNYQFYPLANLNKMSQYMKNIRKKWQKMRPLFTQCGHVLQSASAFLTAFLTSLFKKDGHVSRFYDDVLLIRIELEYMCYYSNLIINDCLWIWIVFLIWLEPRFVVRSQLCPSI